MKSWKNENDPVGYVSLSVADDGVADDGVADGENQICYHQNSHCDGGGGDVGALKIEIDGVGNYYDVEELLDNVVREKNFGLVDQRDYDDGDDDCKSLYSLYLDGGGGDNHHCIHYYDDAGDP